MISMCILKLYTVVLNTKSIHFYDVYWNIITSAYEFNNLEFGLLWTFCSEKELFQSLSLYSVCGLHVVYGILLLKNPDYIHVSIPWGLYRHNDAWV